MSASDRCPTCDYDVSALPGDGRCPECGQALDPASREKARERRHIRRVLRLAAVLLVASMVAVGWVTIAIPERAIVVLPLIAMIGTVVPIAMAVYTVRKL